MQRRDKQAADAEIDRSLRQAFDALEHHPMPDKLRGLLDRLRSDGHGVDASTARTDTADQPPCYPPDQLDDDPKR